MKKTTFLLFAILIAVCIASKCNAQAVKLDQSKMKPAPVTPNAIQVEKLNTAYKEAGEIQTRINELTELIIGYKLDEVDSLRIENGQFKFILKPKK